MAMEPPPKRRRKGWSPLDQEEEDASQPFDVEAELDPGYKFSIERAYADQRFQATMAHIFEKYSRDFEGIGDEIDLMTGEIVVNNGHIHNMRNEGDVGDDSNQDDDVDNEDDDEGVLLEDLVDEEEEEESDAEARLEGDRGEDSTHEEEEEEQEEEEEEDRIMQGREQSHHSTALVPKSAKTPSGALRTNMFGRYGGSSPGFGPSPLDFGPPPFSFGSPPFAAGPWGFPDQFSDPLWNHPDFAIARQAQPQRPALKCDRYNFPVQNGRSSIWASRSRFKDNEEEPLRSAFAAALGKHMARKRTKSRKSLPPASQTAENDDEEDEEAILTGKPPGKRKPRDTTLSEAAGGEDDDDDMLLSGRRSPKQQDSEGREGEKDTGQYLKRATQVARRGRKRKRRATEDVARLEIQKHESGLRSQEPEIPSQTLKEIPPEAAKPRAPEEEDNGAGDRRRSGRVRKQAEFLNKTSRTEALAERRPQKMTIILPSVDPQSRDDYKQVDVDINEEGRLSSPSNSKTGQTGANSDPDLAQSGDKSISDPDGQNISPSTHSDPAPQPDVPDNGQDLRPANSQHKDTDSACVLSDDEAPTALSKPNGKRGGNKPQNPEVQAHGTLEDYTPVTVETVTNVEEADEQPQQQELEDLPVLQQQQQSDEFGTEAPEAISDDMKAPDVTNHRIFDDDSRPVRSSRLRKQRSKGDVTAGKSVADEGNMEPEETICLPSEDFSSAVPLSSSPTRALTRITAEVSLDDKPRRLTREVRWLRSRTTAILSSSPSARESHGSPEVNGSKRKRGRPRKSVAAAAAAAVVEQPAPTQEREEVDREADTTTTTTTTVAPVHEDSSRETAEEPQVDGCLPSPRRNASPIHVQDETPGPSPSSNSTTTTTTLPKPTTSTPSLSSRNRNPQTPRHPHRHSAKVPSSRRSMLSLLSDNDNNNDDDEEEIDELGRNLAAMPQLLSSGAPPTSTSRRIWKSSALTREVYHTPVKKRPSEPVSPGSIVKTPGGTLRACGRDGYRCGRDFCFTCL